MLLIVSLTLSYTWSKHTLMDSVPFILYFIVNGISSNIKWRMSAVWEKQKNQYTSTPHERGEELGLPGTAIPLGPDDKSKAVSKERHTSKTSPVETSSALGIVHTLPTILPPVGNEGVSRHTWCTAWLWAQHSCHSSVTHNSGSTHGWSYPVQTGWIVFIPGCPWGEIQGTLRNERSISLNSETDVSMRAGAMPRLRCGQTHVLEILCPKTCDGVRGCQAEQWSSFLQLVRNAWQSSTRLEKSVTHIPQEHNIPMSYSAISQRPC